MIDTLPPVTRTSPANGVAVKNDSMTTSTPRDISAMMGFLASGKLTTSFGGVSASVSA